MSKKIGLFLFVMLVMWAVLILMATPARRTEAKNPEPAVSATLPPQTQPSDTGATPTEPSEPKNTAYQRVKQILDGQKLNKTACSHWVWSPELNPREDVQGTAAESFGWALAQLAAEREMNPIAAFWELVSAGLYTKREDQSDAMTADKLQIPWQEAKTYPYTGDGAKNLLTDLLALAARMEDGLALEAGLLGPEGTVSPKQVQLAAEEKCYYGYFISGGERSTHILCFYLRSDREGKTITDVEFQLLNLRSAQGSEEALARLDRRGDNQAAALMAAAELLLTGQTQAGQGMVPYTRQVTFYTATIERFHFTAQDETGTLTNYRLRKG